MSYLLKTQKIGFLGAGNMTQAVLKGMIEGGLIPIHNLLVSNRTPGKLVKIKDQFGVSSAESNEDLVENADIVILATKPQDLFQAIEPISQSFREGQIVISLAAGYRMDMLEKLLPQCRIVRVMPNTPSLIGQGVIGYYTTEDDVGLQEMIVALFEPLGTVIENDDEEQFEALMIACSSGTGFVFELMTYFQDWLEEHGFVSEQALKMTIDTFMGAASLAAHSKESISALQAKVTSKKGVTAAGLQSMRELEIERALRISFEKAALRNKEMARENK